jgi:cytidylate kinase
MAVITISRQAGSSGSEEIATRVAELLGYRCFDKRLMAQVAAEVGLSENEVIDFSEENYRVVSFLENLIGSRSRVVASVSTRQRDRTGAETLNVENLNETYCIDLIQTAIRRAYKLGNVVISGRGGQVILQNLPDVFHVRIEAPMKVRVQRVEIQKGLNAAEAREWVVEQDRKSAEYMKRFFGVRWDDLALYHLVINTGKLAPERAAQFIVSAVAQLQPEPVI